MSIYIYMYKIAIPYHHTQLDSCAPQTLPSPGRGAAGPASWALVSAGTNNSPLQRGALP